MHDEYCNCCPDWNDDKNRFQPENRFVGDIEDGKRYPFDVYTKCEADARFLKKSEIPDIPEIEEIEQELENKADKSDLAGLQTKFSTTNKLNPAYISYNNDYAKVSNAEKTSWNDKISYAGSGLTKSGTTINHSNAVTAKTVSAFSQITYDAQGHITGSTDATTAQLRAINSGATSAKIDAIDDMVELAESLQAQIDQIEISSSAESIVAPEVAAARVGADGAAYDTLKERLDAETDKAEQNTEYVDKALSTAITIGDKRVTDDLFEIDGYIQYTEGRVITGESDNYRRTAFMRVYKGQKIEWSLATNLHVAYMLLLKEPDFTSEVLDYGKELNSESVVKNSVYTVVEDGYIVLSSVSDSSSWYCFKTAINTVNNRITYVDGALGAKSGEIINEDDFEVTEYIQYTEGKVIHGEASQYRRTAFMRVYKGQKMAWRLYTDRTVAYMLLLKEPDFTSEVLDYGKEFSSDSSVEKISCYTAVADGYIVLCAAVNTGSWYMLNPVVEPAKLVCEGGCFASETYYSFASRDYLNWSRNAYLIFMDNVKMIRFKQPSTVSKVTFVFFDANGTKIGSKLSEWKYQTVPDNAKWMEFEFEGTTDTAQIDFVGVENMSVVEKKRFQRHTPSEKLTYKVSDKLFDTSRLMLPPNYSIDGDAVPLILWLDGSGNFTTWDDEISQVKVPYLQYLNNEGFAVLSVFSWGYNLWYDIVGLGNAHPYVLPTNLECIKKCIEYIIDRYNIDPNQIHIMSKSQGGQVALYYASNNEINAKTIGMFAPVLDYFSMPGEAMYKGTREGIAKCLGLEGDVNYYTSDEYYTFSDQAKSFLMQNLAKMCRLNSAWANLNGGTLAERFEESWQDGKKYWEQRYWEHTDRTDIYTHSDYSKFATVPVMIWGAADDDNTPYLKMVEVVEQLKNGGSEAYLNTLPNNTGRHSAADGSTVNVVSGTTALGIPYVDIPVGWVENVAFIRQHAPDIEYDESRW
jgi:pimeloyl-ACP methyl ester carboxylesterase